ncbi:MAG: hypothetical protein CV045_09010 [Cyanobacteria bacterium M5B4]|nr:MAG: hypothetical protein CV045_09010 [Cyanobacteria bacterium M5B4]
MPLSIPLPPHFTDHPGDAVAYQAFKACQSIPDLAQRTQLISRGLRYAHSESARKQIEQLLTAPRLPTPYPPGCPSTASTAMNNCPRIFPVAGKFPPFSHRLVSNSCRCTDRTLRLGTL